MHWTVTSIPAVLGLIFLKGAPASRLLLPRQTAKMAVRPSYTLTSVVKAVALVCDRRTDPRYPFGILRTGISNYLWIQHFHSALNKRAAPDS